MDKTTSNPSLNKSTLTDYEVMRRSVGSTPSELRAELRAQLSRAQLSKSAALPVTSSSVTWIPTTSSTTFTLTNSNFTSPHSYITTTSSTTSTLTSSNSSLTSPYNYTTTLSGSVSYLNQYDPQHGGCIKSGHKNPSEFYHAGDCQVQTQINSFT
ncbi:hypothetical protein ACLKA6_003300 [Drosophila palustris]